MGRNNFLPIRQFPCFQVLFKYQLHFEFRIGITATPDLLFAKEHCHDISFKLMNEYMFFERRIVLLTDMCTPIKYV